jgi:hypothetical protein
MQLATAAALVAGCAGTPDALNPSIRWKNQSALSEAQLDAWWQVAQTRIANKPIITHIGSPTNTKPADPRALAITPDGLRVIVHHENGGLYFTSPCGSICRDGKCWGCSRYREYEVHYAEKVPEVLDWEFQNIILRRLGYDISR